MDEVDFFMSFSAGVMPSLMSFAVKLGSTNSNKGMILSFWISFKLLNAPISAAFHFSIGM
jgi:hypothetical protein